MRNIMIAVLAILLCATADAQDTEDFTIDVNGTSIGEDAFDEDVIIEISNPGTQGRLRRYHDEGIDPRDEKILDEAIRELDWALEIDPNLAEAYFYRGSAYAYKGDIDRAIADYTDLIRLDPDYSAEAYSNRGTAYGYKGDIDRAIADYTEAIRLDPNYDTAYYNRGSTYGYKGDYDRAIADYTEAIRLNPDFAEAYYNRGSAYFYKNDLDRAIVDFTEMIRLVPDYAETYNYRGGAYGYKGDYDRAIADFTEAIRLDPNYADAKDNLEIIRKMQRRP